MNWIKKKQICSIAEIRNGKVHPVTYEVAHFAAKVAVEIGAGFEIIVVGEQVRHLAEEIRTVSGFDVLGIKMPSNDLHSSEYFAYQIGSHFPYPKPKFYFVPHTATGWDYACLLAENDEGLITGVQGFHVDKELVFSRSICNGKLQEYVYPLNNKKNVITVMPGSEIPKENESGKKGAINIHEVSEGGNFFRITHNGYTEDCAASVDLSKAEVIISAGRGIKEPEAIKIIEELAARFDKSAVGASRPVCDNGWMDICHQVGMTGQTVRPKLYIACGISGAIQHTVGMKNADLIISINTDKNAPICQTAHYCVVADLHKFIPVLIEKIKEFKSKH